MTDRSGPKKFTLGAALQKQGRALFTGRGVELQAFSATIQARKAWQDSEDELKRVFNVHGQGGAGKTTLLREFEAICRHQGVAYVMADAKRSVGEQILDSIDQLRQSDCYGHLQRWEQARACVREALGYAERSHNPRLVTRCRIQLARVARSQSNSQEALDLLDTIIVDAAGLSEQRQLEVMEEIGLIYHGQGKHKE